MKSRLRRLLSLILVLSVSACTGAAGTGCTGADSRPADTAGEGTEAEQITRTVEFASGTADTRYQQTLTASSDTWSVTLASSGRGAIISAGAFGELQLLTSELFRMEIETGDGTTSTVFSSGGWESVELEQNGQSFAVTFTNPDKIEGLSVEVIGETDPDGISWYTNVTNDNSDCSVSSVSYPTPGVASETLHLFTPERSGRAIMDAGENGFAASYEYPGHYLSMQYFAFWGEENGIYLGIHDPEGGMKTFSVDAGYGEGRMSAVYPAIGAGTAGNSFSAGGCIRWEAFSGDWYDATMLYADFVHTSALWLPEHGRSDTAEKFKEIAMWTVDYSEETNLRGILKIRDYIGAPIATHAYNWHQIQFDTDYPHFLPAKTETADRFREMQAAGVYVVPYINGVSWETLDAETGYEINYENTGRQGVAIYPNGTPAEVQYANLKPSGAAVKLAAMCPGYETWHEIMETLVRDMEDVLPIDGIYFDQIAAVAPIPCRSTTHTHTSGGGGWWSELYNEMILKIKQDRPEESFYFSESSGETYVKSFDGLLTWMWNLDDLVPAFPAVYAGYVQMVGRNTDVCGDEPFFRYHFAQSLLYGQQPGWFYASEYIGETRLSFMKQVTDVRLAYIDFFNYGTLMRPPKIETSASAITASNGDTLDPVQAAVWRSEDGGEAILLLVNITAAAIDASLTLYPEEYGFACGETLNVTIEPESVTVIKWTK